MENICHIYQPRMIRYSLQVMKHSIFNQPYQNKKFSLDAPFLNGNYPDSIIINITSGTRLSMEKSQKPCPYELVLTSALIPFVCCNFCSLPFSPISVETLAEIQNIWRTCARTSHHHQYGGRKRDILTFDSVQFARVLIVGC